MTQEEAVAPTAAAPPAELNGSTLVRHILEAGAEVQTLLLTVKGVEEPVPFRYKKLGYLAKSRCVSLATDYVGDVDSVGNASVKAVFHLEKYKREAIKVMFGDKALNNLVPITDAVIDALDEDMGEQFDSILPNPFGTGVISGSLKKESEPSSEEQPQ